MLGFCFFRWYHNGKVVKNQTSTVFKMENVSRDFKMDTIACEVSLNCFTSSINKVFRGCLILICNHFFIDCSQVTNKIGHYKETRSLHVLFGPKFLDNPTDVSAELGNEVPLRCEVQSSPPASITWRQGESKKVTQFL